MNIIDYINEKKRDLFSGRLTSGRFRHLLEENSESVKTLLTYYECALMEVETKFRVLNQEYSLVHDRNPIQAIKTRMKTLDSIVEKLNRYGNPLSLESIEENVNDIAGVRVICSYPDDIYSLADCLLEQDDVTLVTRKDYISNPKPSGYRSLHLIVSVPIFLEHKKKDMKVEVQFRTIAMDFWASLEHQLQYKKNVPEEKSQRLAEELVECANISAQLDSKMQSIRRRLNNEPAEIDDEIDAMQWL